MPTLHAPRMAGNGRLKNLRTCLGISASRRSMLAEFQTSCSNFSKSGWRAQHRLPYILYFKHIYQFLANYEYRADSLEGSTILCNFQLLFATFLRGYLDSQVSRPIDGNKRETHTCYHPLPVPNRPIKLGAVFAPLSPGGRD